MSKRPAGYGFFLAVSMGLFSALAVVAQAAQSQDSFTITKNQPQIAGTVQESVHKGRSKGFSSDPFDMEHRKQTPKPKVVYGARGAEKHTGPRNQTITPAKDESKLTVTSDTPTLKADRLEPTPQATFSGGEQTLSQMDNTDPAPEVRLRYEHNDSTATRVVINPQDGGSPLYRPMEQDGPVNSAGVYMDIKVKPDVTVQIGGEYCEIDVENKPDNSSKGAVLGLKWDF